MDARNTLWSIGRIKLVHLCNDAWYAKQDNVLEHEELQLHPADAAQSRQWHTLHAAKVVPHRVEVEEVKDELHKQGPENNAKHLLDHVHDTPRCPRLHWCIQL